MEYDYDFVPPQLLAPPLVLWCRRMAAPQKFSFQMMKRPRAVHQLRDVQRLTAIAWIFIAVAVVSYSSPCMALSAPVQDGDVDTGIPVTIEYLRPPVWTTRMQSVLVPNVWKGVAGVVNGTMAAGLHFRRNLDAQGLWPSGADNAAMRARRLLKAAAVTGVAGSERALALGKRIVESLRERLPPDGGALGRLLRCVPLSRVMKDAAVSIKSMGVEALQLWRQKLWPLFERVLRWLLVKVEKMIQAVAPCVKHRWEQIVSLAGRATDVLGPEIVRASLWANQRFSAAFKVLNSGSGAVRASARHVSAFWQTIWAKIRESQEVLGRSICHAMPFFRSSFGGRNIKAELQKKAKQSLRWFRGLFVLSRGVSCKDCCRNCKGCGTKDSAARTDTAKTAGGKAHSAAFESTNIFQALFSCCASPNCPKVGIVADRNTTEKGDSTLETKVDRTADASIASNIGSLFDSKNSCEAGEHAQSAVKNACNEMNVRNSPTGLFSWMSTWSARVTWGCGSKEKNVRSGGKDRAVEEDDAHHPLATSEWFMTYNDGSRGKAVKDDTSGYIVLRHRSGVFLLLSVNSNGWFRQVVTSGKKPFSDVLYPMGNAEPADYVGPKDLIDMLMVKQMEQQIGSIPTIVRRGLQIGSWRLKAVGDVIMVTNLNMEKEKLHKIILTSDGFVFSGLDGGVKGVGSERSVSLTQRDAEIETVELLIKACSHKSARC